MARINLPFGALKELNNCALCVLVSPYDTRNAATKAFVDEKYKTVIHDKASFEAIANGTWSSAKQDPSWRSGFRRYGAAKLFLIMMMHELQSRLDRDPALANLCILGVDPGAMATSLQRRAPWVIRVLLSQLLLPIIAMLVPKGAGSDYTKVGKARLAGGRLGRGLCARPIPQGFVR